MNDVLIEWERKKKERKKEIEKINDVLIEWERKKERKKEIEKNE